MNRWIRSIGFIAALLCAGCAARPAHAQFIGYTSPQTVQQSIYSGTSCAVNLSSGPLPNVGQSVHVVTYTITATAGSAFPDVTIQASTDGVNYVQISDDGLPASTTNGTLVGYGAYPFVQVEVLGGGAGCLITAAYSGTSVSPPNSVGSADLSAYRKNLFSQQSAGSNQNSAVFQAPYANADGFIVFSVNGTGPPAGSSLSVVAIDGNTTGTITPISFPLTAFTNAADQIIITPNFPASFLQLQYTSGGASAATINATYYFFKPGSGQYSPLCEKKVVINTAAAGPTKIISGAAGAQVRICSVAVSSGTAEAIDFQQGTGTNCGTVNAQLTGLTHQAANTPYVQSFPGAGLLGLPSNDVCIHLSGANQTDGTITYSEY